MKRDTLKAQLEKYYNHFGKELLKPDPLQVPYQFSEKKDIEMIALISAVFAYGNIRAIISFLDVLVSRLTSCPHDFITNSRQSDLELVSKDLKYRFNTPFDIYLLLNSLKNIYKSYETLQDLFVEGYNEADINIKNGLNYFSSKLVESAEGSSKTFCYLFPLPEKRSACKRMNMFLRWMVRKDELDFGLWNEVSASKLIIPVDTHIAKISKKLNLTRRKNVSWAMAEEITNNLKKLDSDDPVKYDFALCHIGVRKLNI